jgi:hypothetical protein
VEDCPASLDPDLRVVTMPALKRQVKRPRSYRSSADPGAWAIALRRLWHRGYGDARIAELLSCLSTRAILALEHDRRWDWRTVETMLIPGSGGRWTCRQVEYHRARMGLPGNRVRPELQSAAVARVIRWRRYQTQAGWNHLLPKYDERGREWEPEMILRPRECDILSLLRDNGPMTRPEIGKSLGLSEKRDNLKSGSWHYLERLCCFGLVSLAGLVVRGCVILKRYALGEGVTKPAATRLKTGVEVAVEELGKRLKRQAR